MFEAFATTGIITEHYGALLASAVRFAQLVWGGEQAGTIIWCDYTSIRVRNVLTNPLYAGAYVWRWSPALPAKRRMAKSNARRLGPDEGRLSSPDVSQDISRGLNSRPSQEQLRSNTQSFVDQARLVRRERGRRRCRLGYVRSGAAARCMLDMAAAMHGRAMSASIRLLHAELPARACPRLTSMPQSPDCCSSS